MFLAQTLCGTPLPPYTQPCARCHLCAQNRRKTAGAANGRRRGVRNREVRECLRELHKVCAIWAPVCGRRTLTRAGTVDISPFNVVQSGRYVLR